ncbi:hypothetical protein ABIA30_003953 [Mycobacterium sp. MAA66]
MLRFADVGTATYASLRVVGAPDQLVTWVLDDARLQQMSDQLAAALPDPRPGEQITDALARACTVGAYATTESERELAEGLGALLSDQAWALLQPTDGVPALFVSPSVRLSRVPWGLLAVPGNDLRLIELADVFLAVPPNVVNSPRNQRDPSRRSDSVAVILDPKVPGHRPDSALGSVLGRPSADSALARHFADRSVLPSVADPAELFRRTDVDRNWLAAALAQGPARLIYVGHASAAEDRTGYADRAALHLAEPEPLSAADIIAARLPIPPRVALLACSSGGDYRFDEATGLVAAMILGGAQVVTATLWSLPTTAGYRKYAAPTDPVHDPMSELVIAVDEAHTSAAPGSAVNHWQRACLRRWRDGDVAASPLYWAALVSSAVDGVR